jgi:UPF0716 family protein affecting phage T7 exclusion
MIISAVLGVLFLLFLAVAFGLAVYGMLVAGLTGIHLLKERSQAAFRGQLAVKKR